MTGELKSGGSGKIGEESKGHLGLAKDRLQHNTSNVQQDEERAELRSIAVSGKNYRRVKAKKEEKRRRMKQRKGGEEAETRWKRW